jgi:hypothetical protein
MHHEPFPFAALLDAPRPNLIHPDDFSDDSDRRIILPSGSEPPAYALCLPEFGNDSPIDQPTSLGPFHVRRPISSSSSSALRDERLPRNPKTGQRPCRLPPVDEEVQLSLACFLLIDRVAMSEGSFKLVKGLLRLHAKTLRVESVENGLPDAKTIKKIQYHLNLLQVYEHDVPVDQSKTQTGPRDSAAEVKATSVSLEAILTDLVLGNTQLRKLLHFG